MKAPAFLIAVLLCACSAEETTTTTGTTPMAPEVQSAIEDAEVPTQAEADQAAADSITEDNMDSALDDLEKEIMSDN